jgi:hypothetical protein
MNRIYSQSPEETVKIAPAYQRKFSNHMSNINYAIVY